MRTWSAPSAWVRGSGSASTRPRLTGERGSARKATLIVVGLALLFSLPTLAFFGAVGRILRTAPPPAPISLDVQMDVRRDGVVEVEETATIDYGSNPDVGFFRGFDPRYVTDDGLVLIRRLRFVEAFERMAGGRRRSMPGDLVDEPKLSHYWSFGNDSTKAAGRRTFVLRYEIYGGLRQRAGAVEMPWDLAGLQASGFLRSVSATIEAPGLIDVACAECVNDSVRGDVGRVLARNHSSSTVLDVTATLEAGSVADPRPDLIPTAGRRSRAALHREGVGHRHRHHLQQQG